MQHLLHHKYYGELLPALEIKPDDENEIEIRQEVTVPEIRNKTLKDAIEILENAGLSANYDEKADKDTTIVIDQLPKPGLKLPEGTKIEISI